jgi:hypothetical protein
MVPSTTYVQSHDPQHNNTQQNDTQHNNALSLSWLLHFFVILNVIMMSAITPMYRAMTVGWCLGTHKLGARQVAA